MEFDLNGRLVGGLSGSRESERAYVHDAGHACSNAGVVLLSTGGYHPWCGYVDRKIGTWRAIA